MFSFKTSSNFRLGSILAEGRTGVSFPDVPLFPISRAFSDPTSGSGDFAVGAGTFDALGRFSLEHPGAKLEIYRISQNILEGGKIGYKERLFLVIASNKVSYSHSTIESLVESVEDSSSSKLLAG